MHSVVTGVGSYLPEKVLTNHELEQMVDTQDEWIFERTGIRQRHIAATDETTCDLAEQAALKALKAANKTPDQIDMIIVATTTPDLVFPSTACLLQQRLGVKGCPAFDVQAVCTGFIYIMSIADQFIHNGTAGCVLLVGAETLSRILNWEDRTTCILFGDGAGAVLLEAGDNMGIISSCLHADGSYQDMLKVPSGVSKKSQHETDAFISMQGKEVFKVAVNTLGQEIDDILTTNNMKQEDIDWFVPHQANIRIISLMAKHIGLPMERVVSTIQQHGNTSAASIPLALDTAIADGRIKRGDTLLLEAFGGGFTWGSVLLKY